MSSQGLRFSRLGLIAKALGDEEVHPLRCLPRHAKAVRGRNPVQIVSGDEKTGHAIAQFVEHRDRLAMTDTVLRQAWRPMPNPGNERLAARAEQVPKLLARQVERAMGYRRWS